MKVPMSAREVYESWHKLHGRSVDVLQCWDLLTNDEREWWIDLCYVQGKAPTIKVRSGMASEI